MTTTLTRGSLACPPRFGTRRTSRPTLGRQVGKVAAQVGLPLMPWQQHVADVAFELDDDGSFVYSEVGLEVGRQEGKTALKFVVALHRLCVMVEKHGPQVVTYTMQDRQKARTRLERDYAVRLRNSPGFREIVPQSRLRPRRRHEWRLGMNSGVEHIQFGPDSWLQIDTPSRTGGHGDTLDLGLIDEAFAHEDDTVEVSMEPALLVPADSQLWVMSAAGDAKSKYLWRKVLAGRALVEADVDFGACYFEWSAADDDDPSDPGVWERACPALGHTITEEKLAARWATALRTGQEGIDKFRRSYLCQWPSLPVLGDEAVARWLVIPQHAWAARANPASKIAGACTFAVEVTPDRSESCIGVAGVNEQGVPHRGLTELRPGTSWVVGRVVELKANLGERWRGVVVDKGAPAGDLIDKLEAAGVSVTVAQTPDLKQACGSFFDDATERPMAHPDQPELNAAVAGAQKRKVGEAWAWDRYVPGGSILSAVSLAAWAHNQPSETASVYESRGLVGLGG